MFDTETTVKTLYHSQHENTYQQKPNVKIFPVCMHDILQVSTTCEALPNVILKGFYHFEGM
jgi:hypothetical protein